MSEIKSKIDNRTATKAEYEAYEWNKRFSARRREGVKQFWNQERERIIKGEIIYPVTLNEHLKGWHGGNFKNSRPGEPIIDINDF